MLIKSKEKLKNYDLNHWWLNPLSCLGITILEPLEDLAFGCKYFWGELLQPF
jgi:hypothetical protein